MRMVLGYFKKCFPNADIQEVIGTKHNCRTESSLRAMLKTTEQDGTDHVVMTEALKKIGYSVVCGKNRNPENTEAIFKIMQELISQGIPVIINNIYYEPNGERVGHFVVLTGIDNDKQEMIIADPAARFNSAINFRYMSKNALFETWENGSGIHKQLFIVIFPNQEQCNHFRTQMQNIAEEIGDPAASATPKNTPSHT
ncbi:MAG: C39 family peptidase [Legionellales bacterium]|nr:C39 family peptidase [Legionellales bacterium]